MRIVIAGAKGQLGRALVCELTGHQVMALDHAELDITKLRTSMNISVPAGPNWSSTPPPTTTSMEPRVLPTSPTQSMPRVLESWPWKQPQWEFRWCMYQQTMSSMA